MKSILEWLYESELGVPTGQEGTYQYEEAKEEVAAAKEEVRARLPQELREVWQVYQDKQNDLYGWEQRAEFERGFYLAVQLILELLRGGGRNLSL